MDTSNTASGDSTPSSAREDFLLPNPIPTRRNRTYSTTQRAKDNPLEHGEIKEFCRQQGHGFIIPEDGSEALFVHISDVDGEYVPRAGDKVSYKKVLIPPKNAKYMALHVTITHLHAGEPHETWESVNPKGTPGS